MAAKKAWIVCYCNSRIVVIAKKPAQCVFATIFVFHCKLLIILWLQFWIVCDCKSFSVSLRLLVVVATWLCDYKRWFVMIAKKPKQCVFATIFCVWLQLDVMCGCNLPVSVWLKLLGYLVIYDCKPEQCVIARASLLWLLKKPAMVCVCNYFCVSLQTAGYFMIASLNSVWLQLF
jgi:hypothetical protein